jgi:hypothetical protein
VGPAFLTELSPNLNRVSTGRSFLLVQVLASKCQVIFYTGVHDRIAMHSTRKILPVLLLRLFRVILLLLLPVVGPLLQTIGVAAAPITSCELLVYTCPEADSNGLVLIVNPYAVSPEGPYSIFDCVYVYLLFQSIL